MSDQKLLTASWRTAVLFLAAWAAPGQSLAQSLEIIDLKYRTAPEVIPIVQPLVEPGGALSGSDYKLFLRASAANVAQIKRALTEIAQGRFSPTDPTRFRPIVDDLRNSDWFMVTADYRSYAEMQRKVDAAYQDRAGWLRRAVLNTARVGFFSSDRAIRDYAERIWNVPVGRIRPGLKPPEGR